MKSLAARRTLVALAMLFALVAGARLVRVLHSNGDVLRSREVFVFGSLSTITIAGLDARASDRLLDEIERALGVLHRELHPWEPSALTSLNAELARGAPAQATPTIVELIGRAKPLVVASGGRFDPGIGGYVERYGFHTSEYPVTTPAPDARTMAAMRAQAPSLAQLSVQGGVATTTNPAVQLDFNAVAEGYAAERIAGLVRRTGAKGALIALGGDLYALGDANGRPWKAAIRDPDGGVLGTVELRDGEALFSSGAYGRYREIGGERWPHVIDPRTAEPARGVLATAVLCRNPLVADATATALMLAKDDFADVAKAMGVDAALIVDDEGVVRTTQAMAARVEFETGRRIEPERLRFTRPIDRSTH